MNLEKIMHDLDWTPQESFESGIRRTVEWYLANEDWVNALMSEKYQEWIAVNYAQRDEIAES